MSFWKKLFGRKDKDAETVDLAALLSQAAMAGGDENADGIPDDWHAMIVNFDYGSTELAPLHALEDELEQVIKEADVGVFDGHEIALDGSDGFYYMYGPDADRLAEVALPVLRQSEFCKGARITLRFGSVFDDAVPEKEFILDE